MNKISKKNNLTKQVVTMKDKSIKKLPLEYPRREMFGIYAKRLLLFLAIAVGNILLLGIFVLIPKLQPLLPFLMSLLKVLSVLVLGLIVLSIVLVIFVRYRFSAMKNVHTMRYRLEKIKQRYLERIKRSTLPSAPDVLNQQEWQDVKYLLNELYRQLQNWLDVYVQHLLYTRDALYPTHKSRYKSDSDSLFAGPAWLYAVPAELRLLDWLESVLLQWRNTKPMTEKPPLNLPGLVEFIEQLSQLINQRLNQTEVDRGRFTNRKHWNNYINHLYRIEHILELLLYALDRVLNNKLVR
jgi:hypothetical protein